MGVLAIRLGHWAAPEGVRTCTTSDADVSYGAPRFGEKLRIARRVLSLKKTATF
jgi:hypothetical protein